jgi:hypothetical protein
MPLSANYPDTFRLMILDNTTECAIDALHAVYATSPLQVEYELLELVECAETPYKILADFDYIGYAIGRGKALQIDTNYFDVEGSAQDSVMRWLEHHDDKRTVEHSAASLRTYIGNGLKRAYDVKNGIRAKSVNFDELAHSADVQAKSEMFEWRELCADVLGVVGSIECRDALATLVERIPNESHRVAIIARMQGAKCPSRTVQRHLHHAFNIMRGMVCDMVEDKRIADARANAESIEYRTQY